MFNVCARAFNQFRKFVIHFRKPLFKQKKNNNLMGFEYLEPPVPSFRFALVLIGQLLICMSFRRILEFNLLSNGHRFKPQNEYISHFIWCSINIFAVTQKGQFWFWLNIMWMLCDCGLLNQYRKWYPNREYWLMRIIWTTFAITISIYFNNTTCVTIILGMFGFVVCPIAYIDLKFPKP